MANKPRLLIDGDIPLYQVAFSCEVSVDWGDDFWTLHADMGEARETFTYWVEAQRKATQCLDVVVALSDTKANWRTSIFQTYKGNRAGKRKPVIFNPLRDFVKQRYETIEYPTLEADDVLGVIYESGDIIASADKDLLTIPGKHFNPQKREEGINLVNKKAAYRNHMVQTLAGDQTDNYPGCPGVGVKTADKLLMDLTLKDMWPCVVERFRKSGLEEDEALLQARLAHILHPGEYDFDTNSVLMWTP